ncbi:GntR family transcriptional regulator [Lignipirellula cremea]|uniref:HTH-type transcriptional repressor YvoA n=1 Tax=Lignipirellula cremea TaxID=2528010 RepID=A0A518E526_9BACT|nr:GntR family transcriptional regulator [Lignipirellula cremea]QDU99196.1 HTH-type transcriptional repressor YvoA [Lignipirellula cremea]
MRPVARARRISYSGLATGASLPTACIAIRHCGIACCGSRTIDTHLQRNPVYQQLNERLRASLGGEYQCGDKFLTEREISEQFAVSRATANKALASLVSEGLLEFRRGVGTFVRRDIINYDLRSLVSFTEKAKAAGKTPGTQLTVFQKTVAAEVDPLVQQALGVAADAPLWEMERLRLADGSPVILERRFVAAEHCPRLTRTQARGGLYRAFTEAHGLQVAGADEILRAVALQPEEAQSLGVPAQSPALEVVAVGFLEDRSALWWERTLYRGDQYEFHSRLGPIQSATPPRGKLRQAD